MEWFQNYNPLRNWALSTVVAALPIVVLLGSIAFLKMRIHFAALLGLLVALAVAVFAFQMPVVAAAATTAYGAAYGLFPIGWIILNLIFLYQLTVHKGLFTVLRSSLASLARLQTVASFRTLAHREHRARRLWRARHSHHCAGRSHGH